MRGVVILWHGCCSLKYVSGWQERYCALSQNLREHLAQGVLIAGRKVAHATDDERLFERGQDWFCEGRFEQPGGLPVNDRKGSKVRRSVRLAGDCHDEQVRAVGVVSGAGDDYGRTFLALRLIGERKWYEDNLAKLVNGF